MNPLQLPIAAALLFGTAACTTMGTGIGSSPSGNVHALLMWKGSDRSGMMTAMLNTGTTYTGMYFQITGETRVDDLGPLWIGWARPWAGWPYWGGAPSPRFITYYSGRVVANLEGPNGTHMRCRFQLFRPATGMAGGGQGQCQLPNGTTIDASFPAT